MSVVKVTQLESFIYYESTRKLRYNFYNFKIPFTGFLFSLPSIVLLVMVAKLPNLTEANTRIIYFFIIFSKRDFNSVCPNIIPSLEISFFPHLYPRL